MADFDNGLTVPRDMKSSITLGTSPLEREQIFEPTLRAQRNVVLSRYFLL